MKTLITTLILTVSIVAFSQDYENYTYKLSQSKSGFEIWTATPALKVLKNDAVPETVSDKIKVYCAKNEFEPFQIIIKSGSQKSVNISMGDFGSGIKTEINRVDYINLAKATDDLGTKGDFPDPLIPIENASTVNLKANENNAFWISIFVPESTAGAKNYTANITVDGINIPVELHVFNFAIAKELHVKSQMNISDKTILTKYGVQGTGAEYWTYVDKIKQYFIDHRLTTKSVLWSGGLTSSGGKPYIDYDCNGNLSDNDGIWGFEKPAERYLKGSGLMDGKFQSAFNGGTGFPSFMCATFKNNDPSNDQRPDEFCGIKRNGTWKDASSAYNNKWFAYIKALQNYLSSKNYLDKAYYYIANEPQNQADYDAIAWYSQELKKAAPNLKLMVSEEPKSEIYNHPNYNAKVDIWLPVLNQYNPETSWKREAENKEETWVYFLHGTRPPYFNPITLDHQGIEAKLTGWFLWKYRIKGIAYYSVTDWSKNPWTNPMTSNQNGNTYLLYPPSKDNNSISYGSNNHRFVPSIRLELIRDGLEDYEYLYELSNGQPQVNVDNNSDKQVNKIVTGLSSYSRDPEFMYNLRRLIGLKNGGEISEIPSIEPQAGHWRSKGNPENYYVNFQNPADKPTTSTTETVEGKNYKYYLFESNKYLQVGTNKYDKDLGYGWFAPNDVNWKMTYDKWFDNGNELQKSQVFSDWGRKATFEFDIPNGDYKVTVGIGHRNTYKKQFVKVEGVTFYENASTSNGCLSTSKDIKVADNKLTMEIGNGTDYTMLNFIKIESGEPQGINDLTNRNHNVYPNPVTKFATFEIDRPAKLHIYDSNGKLIYSDGIDSRSNKKDLSFLKEGIYVYKIMSDKDVFSGKIIKK